MASTENENKKEPSKPFIKVKGLVTGADEFITLGSKTHLPVGVYDMEVTYRVYEKDNIRMSFFDLVKALPVKVAAV